MTWPCFSVKGLLLCKYTFSRPFLLFSIYLDYIYIHRQITQHLQRIKSRRADIPNPEIPVRIHLATDKVPDLIRGKYFNFLFLYFHQLLHVTGIVVLLNSLLLQYFLQLETLWLMDEFIHPNITTQTTSQVPTARLLDPLLQWQQ